MHSTLGYKEWVSSLEIHDFTSTNQSANGTRHSDAPKEFSENTPELRKDEHECQANTNVLKFEGEMAGSLTEIKEAEDIKQLAVNSRAELEELKKSFKKKGTVGLWWDSKIPESNKKEHYFYFFSMKSSNKEQVVKEIEKFSEFFGKFENVSESSFDEVEKLDEDVKEMIKVAQQELDATGCTTVYKVCKDLISCGLDEKVGKVKNALGTYEFKKLRGNLKQVVKIEAEKLNKEYKDENQKHKEEYKVLLAEKRKLEESHEAALRQLKKESEDMYEKFEESVQQSKQAIMHVVGELERERTKREEMEKKLKEESEVRAKEIEKTLSMQSQKQSEEREKKMMSEMAAMTEQIKQLIKQPENLKSLKASSSKRQSCPDLLPDKSSFNKSSNPIDDQSGVRKMIEKFSK